MDYFQSNYLSFYKKYLPNVKKLGGDEYQAICPFHEDAEPSFSFNNHKGQYYCHGCGKKGDIVHFYSKVNGLDTRRDFPKILKGIANDFGIVLPEKTRSRIVNTYDYTDETGKPLFQVCRMSPKDFRQRQPNGPGKWKWNLKGIEPVLYHLPKLLNAEEILVCEGEKDADNLTKLGFTATTAPMGANKWRESYNKPLFGKNVVLLPDNDNQGREHMARVGASLNGYAASIKLLNLPGLPSKGDVSDFISSFKDSDEAAERLAVMIENSEPYEPPKKVTIDNAVLSISDFHQIKTDQRKVYLKPWLKEDAIVLISGWRGAGKTFFALSLLDAVASGGKCGPWECQEAVSCLFLDGEMPKADIDERLEILNVDTNQTNTIFIYSDSYANSLGLPRANLNSTTWRQTMYRILTTKKIRLWIIDNLASVAGGLDENSRQDWDPINQWLLELRFAGITTIMLHHTGKGGAQRGTSAREDNLDCSIVLKAPPDYIPEDGARFICHFSKARVRTSELAAIQDMEFWLKVGEDGKHLWTWGNVKKELRAQILTMLDEGTMQIEVAKALGISRGQVSKVRSKAIKDGYLTEKNKLTQGWFMDVSR